MGSGSSRGGSCSRAGEMVAGLEEEDDSAAMADSDPAGRNEQAVNVVFAKIIGLCHITLQNNTPPF